MTWIMYFALSDSLVRYVHTFPVEAHLFAPYVLGVLLERPIFGLSSKIVGIPRRYQDATTPNPPFIVLILASSSSAISPLSPSRGKTLCIIQLDGDVQLAETFSPIEIFEGLRSREAYKWGCEDSKSH
jgi:hypothetical protein